MASSIYVFDSKSSYLSYYGGLAKDELYSSPVRGIWVYKNRGAFKQIVLSVKIVNTKDRPSFTRSIVIILDGSLVSDKTSGKFLEITNEFPIIYNKKTKNLEVKPHKWQFWREPDFLNHHTDRFIGNMLSDKRIPIKTEAYFDSTRNRVCFILEC